jgi:glutaredoxin
MIVGDLNDALLVLKSPAKLMEMSVVSIATIVLVIVALVFAIKLILDAQCNNGTSTFAAGLVKVKMAPTPVHYIFDPKCPHCKSFKKDWSTISKKLKKAFPIQIIEHNLSKLKKGHVLPAGFDNSVPAIVMNGRQFKGERTSEAIFKFVEQNLNTSHLFAIDTPPVRTEHKAAILSAPRPLPPTPVHYIFDPKCPHCKSFKKDWPAISRNLTRSFRVKIIEHDLSKIKKGHVLPIGFDRSVPAIVMNGRQFKGERTNEAIFNFVEENINAPFLLPAAPTTPMM